MPENNLRQQVSAADSTRARLLRLVLPVLNMLVPGRPSYSLEQCLDSFRASSVPVGTDDDEYLFEAEVEAETGELLEDLRKIPGYEGSGLVTLELAKWAQDRDDDRTRTLDAKATALESQTVTSLTLLFALGGVLMTNRASIGPFLMFLATAYTIALGLLLLAFRGLMQASRVRKGWASVNQQDLFHPGETVANERATYLAVHVWRIYRRNKLVNDRKAELLVQGERLLKAAMHVLLWTGISVGSYLFWIGYHA